MGEVLIARTFSTVHGERVVIRVQNLSDSPQYINRHQKLAQTFIIDPADVIQVNDVSVTHVGINTVRVCMDQSKSQTEQCVHPDLMCLHLSTEEREKLQVWLYKIEQFLPPMRRTMDSTLNIPGGEEHDSKYIGLKHYCA